MILTLFIVACGDEPSISPHSPTHKKVVLNKYKIYPVLIEIPEINENVNLIDYIRRLYKFDSTIVLTQNGQYYGFYKDKTLAFTGNFKNSKPHGIFYFLDKLGKIMYSIVYQEGVKEGPIIFYSNKGHLKASGIFSENNLIGNWHEWYDYKTLRYQRIIDKTNKISSYEYNSNGILISKSFVLDETDSNVTVSTTDYYDNGNIKESYKNVLHFYKGSYFIDSAKAYYQNMQLEYKGCYTKKIGSNEIKIIYSKDFGIYKNFFKIGKWTYYDSIGNIKSMEYYNNSFKLIKIDEYYSSGSIKSTTCYNGSIPYSCSRSPGYDVREGEYIEYYEDKTIKISGVYYRDKRNGTWKYFQQNGKLTKTEIYANDTLQ